MAGFFEKLGNIPSALKKIPTAYWILGVGGAGLAIDYAYEGQGSIVSSLWRMMTGGGGHRGSAHPHAGHPLARHSRVPARGVMPSSVSQVLATPQFISPPYYEAWPSRHHVDWHDWGRRHGFDHGFGRQGYGYGGRAYGGHGYGGFWRGHG